MGSASDLGQFHAIMYRTIAKVMVVSTTPISLYKKKCSYDMKWNMKYLYLTNILYDYIAETDHQTTCQLHTNMKQTKMGWKGI